MFNECLWEGPIPEITQVVKVELCKQKTINIEL